MIARKCREQSVPPACWPGEGLPRHGGVGPGTIGVMVRQLGLGTMPGMLLAAEVTLLAGWAIAIGALLTGRADHRYRQGQVRSTPNGTAVGSGSSQPPWPPRRLALRSAWPFASPGTSPSPPATTPSRSSRLRRAHHQAEVGRRATDCAWPARPGPGGRPGGWIRQPGLVRAAAAAPGQGRRPHRAQHPASFARGDRRGSAPCWWMSGRARPVRPAGGGGRDGRLQDVVLRGLTW